MRARIRCDKLLLTVSFANENYWLDGLGIASNMVCVDKTILVDLTHGDKCQIFKKPSQQDCSWEQVFPYHLTISHNGMIPAFGPIELMGEVIDKDLLQFDLPPLYERPWPVFKDDGDMLQHAHRCMVQRAASLMRNIPGCEANEARRRLKLTENSKNAIPHEAWHEVSKMFRRVA